jgi:choriolysin H
MADSVMHYEKYASAIDKTRPTIIPIPDENIELGNRLGFSSVRI